MKGKLYGIGTGPGDPELLTLAAVRTLKSCDVIAVPATSPGERTAFSIVKDLVQDKPKVECVFSMDRDPQVRIRHREKVLEMICQLLDENKQIGFITLGDPTVYSTYMYVHQAVKKRGYETQIISGIPSFIQAAAALDISLCEGNEPLHIIPGQGKNLEEFTQYQGTRVIMKAGKNMEEVLKALEDTSNISIVTRVAMEGEAIYKDLATYRRKIKPNDKPNYFSIVIAKEEKQ